MESATVPPVLSTPAEHLLQETIPSTVPSNETILSEEEFHIQYEIPRTIREIRNGRWNRIALQFPDEMLRDAPKVYERLRDGLRPERRRPKDAIDEMKTLEKAIDAASLDAQDPGQAKREEDDEVRLCILADTSYGACCVDEVAAEHIDAEAVVHYGRTCLSPTARLPVIYVFTSSPVDLEAVLSSFQTTHPSKDEKVCIMADIPHHHNVQTVYDRLRNQGYTNLFAPEIVHDPSSLIPNRTVPAVAKKDPEALKEYSVFHISNPPAALVLTLASRVKDLRIFSSDTTSSGSATYQPTSTALLRRRYALLTRITTAPIIGLLVNTLSVSNYMSALNHCQAMISAAGKKSYTFVVGKVNVAKLANFSEVAAWVVISCWESSLLEGLERDFLAPVVTPFELEVALKGEAGRLYGGEWSGDFSTLLNVTSGVEDGATPNRPEEDLANGEKHTERNWDDELSDQEEPDFDLRTGKYVTRSRPMGRPTPTTDSSKAALRDSTSSEPAPPSSALVQRAKGDVVAINGAHSPAAEFLRSKRTWQGLGSDYEIAYERDEDGKIRGAAVEEGRGGVAKGYRVGDDGVKS